MIHCSILSITKTNGKIFLALVIQLGRGDRHLPGSNLKKTNPKLQEENLKKPYEIILKKKEKNKHWFFNFSIFELFNSLWTIREPEVGIYFFQLI